MCVMGLDGLPSHISEHDFAYAPCNAQVRTMRAMWQHGSGYGRWGLMVGGGFLMLGKCFMY